MRISALLFAAAALLAALPLAAQQPAAPARQTDADAYTRYELLAPGSAKFRITYEITATTPGASDAALMLIERIFAAAGGLRTMAA